MHRLEMDRNTIFFVLKIAGEVNEKHNRGRNPGSN
jgi:hypothetical protein